PPHQRKGYGAQAARMGLDYLYNFTMAHNVSNGVSEWNQAGLAFIRKMGFTQVGVRRASEYMGGRFYDVLVFDLLKTEWKEGDHAS
ncbi:MAG: GNAT family N-acetyltransferase, partial [Anaerolineales bacterium]